ncbi:unnamed protein product [Colias eurytheme]|nr:unnamed protein product [Colias eurytheme]
MSSQKRKTYHGFNLQIINQLCDYVRNKYHFYNNNDITKAGIVILLLLLLYKAALTYYKKKSSTASDILYTEFPSMKYMMKFIGCPPLAADKEHAVYQSG